MAIVFVPSEKELKVTLWGDQAMQFGDGDDFAAQPLQSVVILFVGCLPRSMN